MTGQQPHITAGARVRIVIEDTVEHTNSPGELVTTSGVELRYDPEKLHVEVIDPGWQIGDIVHDGRQQLVRVVRHGIPAWQQPNECVIYDDETRLADLRIISRPSHRANTEETP